MTGIEITIAKQLGSIIARKFGTKVIERWTRYRANKFFEGFVESLSEELKTGVKSKKADEALETILDDDKKSEVLFDSYRAVCFAKSKTLGPKIIGILTGYLIIEGRSAQEDEEKVFRAAEHLSDIELIELSNEFKKWAEKADAYQDNNKDAQWVGNSIVIPWHEEVRDSSWPHSREAEIDISPLNFEEVFRAQWAAQAERLGLLSGRMTQRQQEYKEDSERHIDEDGVLTIYASTLTFEAACKKLCELIERCLDTSVEEKII